MKYILIILLLLTSCNWSKPPVVETTPLELLPAEVEQKKTTISNVIKDIKDSKSVKSVKDDIISTSKYDDFKLIDQKLVIELDTSVVEGIHTAELLRDQRETTISVLKEELNKLKDAEFKSERNLLHFILWISVLGFFTGIVAAYFNRHLIQISLVSLCTGLVALGILKSLSIIIIISVVVVVFIIGLGIAYIIKKNQA